MLRHPIAGHALGLGDLVGGHAFGDYLSAVLRLFVTLRDRKAEPHVRGDVVLRNAFANGVGNAEVVLRLGITLLGGSTVPLHRLSIVLRHALAVGVQDAEVELRRGIPVFGGHAIPLRRFGIVL